jgi:hypothetical protein
MVMQLIKNMGIGILLALLFLEILLRFLPVSTSTETGYYISPNINTYPANHEFVISTGWNLDNPHHHRSNNYGFLTQKDFVIDKNAIAVIGDSYVEANMLAEGERLSSQLENKLKSYAVYAMGGPGSSLLDYAERARFAKNNFGIRKFVFVIERGDIRQTLCGSGNIHGPCLDPVTFELRSEAKPQNINLAKKLLRKSALAQYLVSHLRLKAESIAQIISQNTASENNKPNAKNTSPETMQIEASDRILQAFLAKLAELKMEHWVLVFDSNKTCIATGNQEQAVRNRFIHLAEAMGAKIVDSSKHFCSFTEKTGLSLSVSPTDKHWNRLAHGLVADAVAEKLMVQ